MPWPTGDGIPSSENEYCNFVLALCLPRLGALFLARWRSLLCPQAFSISSTGSARHSQRAMFRKLDPLKLVNSSSGSAMYSRVLCTCYERTGRKSEQSPRKQGQVTYTRCKAISATLCCIRCKLCAATCWKGHNACSACTCVSLPRIPWQDSP